MLLSCAVALVLLMDVSGSLTDQHMRQQQDATARALTSERITDIIQTLPGGLAVKAIAFGPWPDVITPWTIIQTPEQASNFALQLRQYQRDDTIQNGTYLGRAMNFAIDQFDSAPCEPDEMVIDISTDGEADPGPVQEARDRAEELLVRINAIGIGRPELLSSFLYQNVITSTGFHMTVESWHDFERAIRRKIALEIAQVN
jgi:Ca-activated chloride channel homolog